MKKLSEAIWILKDLAWKNGHGVYCWCDMRIGRPMVREHSRICKQAQEFLKENA